MNQTAIHRAFAFERKQDGHSTKIAVRDGAATITRDGRTITLGHADLHWLILIVGPAALAQLRSGS